MPTIPPLSNPAEVDRVILALPGYPCFFSYEARYAETAHGSQVESQRKPAAQPGPRVLADCHVQNPA